jgi:glycosyltransferase involved in cell wall biosynthesis
LALARHLPRTRIESTVAVIKDSPTLGAPPLCEHAAGLGLPTKVFESHGKLSLSAVGQIRRFIRDAKIDVLHTHGYKSDLIGYLAARGTLCRTIATPHGWSVNAGLKLNLYEALDRICFHFIDAVAPLSDDLFSGLARLPALRAKLHLIRNGVDLTELDSTGSTPPEIQAWRAEGAIVIGYVGQLITRKRVDLLLRAFQRLDVSGKRLCLVGDGPQRAEFERVASDLGEARRVAFLGYREDRLALLKGFDLFVLASDLEGIPRCLMEAMGAGIATVASDIPGCRELVEEGITGLLFDAGDAESLARQMNRLIGDPTLRERVARAGRDRIRRTYSAEAMAGSYLDLYERLMDRRAPLALSRKSA